MDTRLKHISQGFQNHSKNK